MLLGFYAADNATVLDIIRKITKVCIHLEQLQIKYDDTFRYIEEVKFRDTSTQLAQF
jgi:hypothetical protein